MAATVNVGPSIINLVATRKADAIFRVTIFENNERADLTGDTLTVIAKDTPGGVEKINESLALEPQTGDTLGDAIMDLSRTDLVGPGVPNDSPTVDVVWVYEIQRLHGSKLTKPIAGTITLGETI